MVKTLFHDSKVIAKVFVADSFLERFLGYMFRKEPHHEAMVFNPCNSIHTFFMKFNIDVLFIDEHFKVINKIENLEKGKVVFPQKGATKVIESKVGVFKNINVGDKIEIKTK